MMETRTSLPPPGTALAAGVALLWGLGAGGLRITGILREPYTSSGEIRWDLGYSLLDGVELVCFLGLAVVGVLLLFRVPRAPQWGAVFSGGLLLAWILGGLTLPGLFIDLTTLLFAGAPLPLMLTTWWSWRVHAHEGRQTWWRWGILITETTVTFALVAIGASIGAMLVRSNLALGPDYHPGQHSAVQSASLDPDDLEIRLPTLDGGERSPRRPESTATVLEFWGTWCLPCRAQMPDMVRLQGENGSRGVEVVLVHVGDREPEWIRKILAESGGGDLTCLLDVRETLWERTGFRGVPSTLLLGPRGEVVAVYEGVSDGQLEIDLLRLLRSVERKPRPGFDGPAFGRWRDRTKRTAPLSDELARLLRREVRRRVASMSEVGFLRGLSPFDVAAPDEADLKRMAELALRYRDIPLGGTDASVIALAERMATDLVVTLDRRHFGAVKPRHRPRFEILPPEG